MDEKLIQFVDHARDKGLDHATIRQLLVSAGWKEKDVAEVFCTRELELPIPEPPRVGPAPVRGVRRTGSIWPRMARDGFLHLLTYGALYTCATSLIVLFFICIILAFPDPAWRMSHSALVEALSIIRVQLAVLIVFFPVFLISWHYLLREVRREPEKAKGGIRRWLGYLSLFVFGITMAVDAIALIYLLLDGQLTVRFVLQAAVLFLIAGGLVGYLGFTLRPPDLGGISGDTIL